MLDTWEAYRTIGQAVVLSDARGPAVVASTTPSHERDDALRTLTARYGDRSAGARWPDAVFVAPFGSQVAVVQVADLGAAVGFRFLTMNAPLLTILNDPFAIAAQFPPDWNARRELPLLRWPDALLPPRTVGELQAVLKTGDGPLLLGAAQAVLDGGRVRLADPADVPKVWALLPDRTRAELRPATFAPDDSLRFHLSAGPPVATPGVLSADQCRDYPEGRYELALQIAVEAGDQAGLARLLARRSSRDTLKLAATMVGLAVGGAIILKLLG